MFTSVFVDNGSNLTPAVVKAIAISPDGVNWDYIQKSQIAKVTPVFIPFVQASQANSSYPFLHWCEVHIVLTNGGEVKFDCQAVINQNSWCTAAVRSGGTAPDAETGLKNAINDITGFL